MRKVLNPNAILDSPDRMYYWVPKVRFLVFSLLFMISIHFHCLLKWSLSDAMHLCQRFFQLLKHVDCRNGLQLILLKSQVPHGAKSGELVGCGTICPDPNIIQNVTDGSPWFTKITSKVSCCLSPVLQHHIVNLLVAKHVFCAASTATIFGTILSLSANRISCKFFTRQIWKWWNENFSSSRSQRGAYRVKH